MSKKQRSNGYIKTALMPYNLSENYHPYGQIGGSMGMPVGKLRKGHHPQHGSGFFDSIGNFFKKGWNYVKDNGLISKGLGFIPGVGGLVGSTVAKQLGVGKRVGRKRKVGRPRK
jgi:hypothetical protein